MLAKNETQHLKSDIEEKLKVIPDININISKENVNDSELHSPLTSLRDVDESFTFAINKPKRLVDLQNRHTYGSNFNNIKIENNRIIKENINLYGYSKIIKEINYYKYIAPTIFNIYFPKILNIKFNIGEKLKFSPDIKVACIEMEYLENYEELYKIFYKIDKSKQLNILTKIFTILNTIHKKSEYNINQIIYTRDLMIETKDKLITRFKEIEHIINEYRHIKYVNNIKIKTFDEILSIIEVNVLEYIKSKSNYTYSLIHGDCQFSNILIHKNNDIKFIDPRGYFGNTMLFGIPEYDIAKVFFALSGYDHFDNQIIEELNIINDNINIKLESYDFDSVYNLFPLYSKNFIIILMITIWLGNAHIYKSNINKCITSYFIGLLQAKLLL